MSEYRMHPVASPVARQSIVIRETDRRCMSWSLSQSRTMGWGASLAGLSFYQKANTSQAVSPISTVDWSL